MSEQPALQLPVPVEARCLNCNAALYGEYCAHCGQHTKHHVHSTGAVVAEIFEDLTHADHRVWSTLRPLVLRPGEVTVEYLRGKRASYTPPFRLYIVLSLLFFLTASLSHSDVEVKVVDAGSTTTTTYELSPESKSSLDVFLQRVEPADRAETRRNLEAALRSVPPEEQVQIVASMFNPCSDEALGALLPHTMLGREQLLRACKNITQENGEKMAEKMAEHVPQMLFFLLPLIALFGKLLYLGSRRYYAEHLLFFVHVHAFFFLAGIFNNIVGWLLGWFEGGWAGTVSGLTTAALILYVPVYLYRAMRRVYPQHRWLTRLKFLFLIGAYLGSVLVTFIGLAAFSAMTLE